MSDYGWEIEDTKELLEDAISENLTEHIVNLKAIIKRCKTHDQLTDNEKAQEKAAMKAVCC